MSASGGLAFQACRAHTLELLHQLVVGDIPYGAKRLVDDDQPRLDLAVVHLLVYIRVLGQLFGIEVDVPQLGSAAEILIELAVDGDGDLFQRPARPSAT